MNASSMPPKLFSGRWLLTLISGLVFAYVACQQILPPTATAAILTAVFTSYFQRSDRAPRDPGTVSATDHIDPLPK